MTHCCFYVGPPSLMLAQHKNSIVSMFVVYWVDTLHVCVCVSGQHNVSSCVPCSPGEYCASPALAKPTDLCDPGWYCSLGSYLAQPSDPEGGKCLAG